MFARIARSVALIDRSEALRCAAEWRAPSYEASWKSAVPRGLKAAAAGAPRRRQGRSTPARSAHRRRRSARAGGQPRRRRSAPKADIAADDSGSRRSAAAIPSATPARSAGCATAPALEQADIDDGFRRRIGRNDIGSGIVAAVRHDHRRRLVAARRRSPRHSAPADSAAPRPVTPDIGRPAPAALERRADPRHHLGIEAGPAIREKQRGTPALLAASPGWTSSSWPAMIVLAITAAEKPRPSSCASTLAVPSGRCRAPAPGRRAGQARSPPR